MKAEPVTPPAVAGLVMTGAAAMPVPLRATMVGLVGALEVIVIAPVSAPTALGAKIRFNTQLMPAGILIGAPVLGAPPAVEPKPQ